MSNIPVDLKYAKTHEWARLNKDGSVTVGISDSAQDQLGDMVFVELPEAGQEVVAEEACAVVESVKAASDVYAPISGEVVEVNEALADSPETVNQDAFGAGWIFRLQPAAAADLDGLMDAEAYEAFLATEAH
ncbi:MAG: glycine cleavage system protein GcvH [Gammaproteobacteria bacterium]|nr:glycine cleavage system protein GcvH [Gammaproteobacteria bacterium]MDH3560176.1 glycine cleavage system protein GcvH [Gammaproteobacteria bacterium]